MITVSRILIIAALFGLSMEGTNGASAGQNEAALPIGVKADWDMSRAYAERTPTREKVCINGLWRWQPGNAESASVPAGGWGYFKVPGCWPGITDYMQKDCQTVYPHPSWKNTGLQGIASAWYQREITIPANWAGRKIMLSAEYVNSLAVVFIDNKKAGEIRFPSGDLNITALCRPGSRHLLCLQVTAMPLKAVLLSYTDTNAARMVKGVVNRRGLCGDVWLVSEPQGTRISNLKIDTSVRRGEIKFKTTISGLTGSQPLIFRVDIRDHGKSVRRLMHPTIGGRGTPSGPMEFEFTEKWKPDKLWDIHTPQNIYTAQLTLLDSAGKPLDVSHPVRFGFREFWIQGKDFYLNGSRIYLSALPLDNAQVGAEWAGYEGAKESMERLKSFGINFVYTHNYDCEPGSHLSFSEILRAADDTGMLVALTQPHFSNYDWQAPDADKGNGYATHAAFFAKVAQEHPSVVAYAMSHNATSYDEAKNPDKMDGRPVDRDSWSGGNVKKAQRAEAIVNRLDPSRIVYHHSSGNLGTMYTENFYVNFAPIQELSDWFEHWATDGVKPLFLCEYGVPVTWDWAMYRGWYKDKREWGSARVPWELCVAEWNAQFFGDKAYRITGREKADIRWEAARFKSADGWYRWDYPTEIGSGAFEERNPVLASYITDNWRAFRTWGVSAWGPWEYQSFWTLRPGVDRRRKQLPVEWEKLQRPGFSADYIDQSMDSMPVAYERKDWVPSVAAAAVSRNNGPLLSYIGGKKSRFTSKDHIFRAGETVEKQIILINNSRVTTTCDCTWTLESIKLPASSAHISVKTGEQARIPVEIKLPDGIQPGTHRLTATVRFSSGETQEDTFDIEVLAPSKTEKFDSRIGLFDPKGETRKLLEGLGIQSKALDSTSDLSGIDILIIGKGALTLSGAVPDVKNVRRGLKVILFEQTAEVLEQRLGFRIAEYGLRQAFPRVADHPILAGLNSETLRDWQGESTTLPPRLQYTLKPMYGPMVKWCGIDVPHVWRCGNQGNVASALIEKPASGDFLPIIDGGYSLQYSPLLLYREGSGMVLFCQMDVTGRTEAEPAAQQLVRNILQYTAHWKPAPKTSATYAGLDAAKSQLRASGITLSPLSSRPQAKGDVLIVGPGGEKSLDYSKVRDWISAGGRVLLLGLNESEVDSLLPGKFQFRTAEHMASWFESGKTGTWLEGICAADVHNRAALKIPLITGGAEFAGDGVLACLPDSSVVLCQLVPWQLDPKQMGQKRTFRRTSCLLTRLAVNMGISTTSPIVENLSRPWAPGDRRWLSGLYLDIPEEWDDPYRFFPW